MGLQLQRKNLMKIQIIKSAPAEDQESIEKFIGKIYDVVSFDREDNTFTVHESEYGGHIALQKREIKIIPESSAQNAATVKVKIARD